ncbi:MAG: HypC/HybG/HupF family hydrogenase formation chaperone [Elusimicrobia bacterium]|nr:HypC/HybG/HupF family hydrogenase formation chaperone [Elusimicrobiota bacterium]
MCLGIPGKVASIAVAESGLAAGKIDFNGIVKDACLAYVPEAKVGDYVIVHAGFAISVLDEASAAETFKYLDELEAAGAGQEQP